MIDYVLVYDARTEPLAHWSAFLIRGVIAALLGVSLWRRRGTRPPPGEPLPGFLGNETAVATVAIIAWVVAAASMVIPYAETTRLRSHLRDGEYVLVEGRVENFVPGDRGGHREESWTVRSGGRTHSYRYSTASMISGFHQGGGPVRAGIRVRLADVDGYIARLEIER